MSFTVDVRESYTMLASAQKPGAGVPYYMRFANRRFGRMIAAVAKRLGATPDQMTAASARLFVAGMSVLVWSSPSILVALVVTVLLQLAFAFDSADGQSPGSPVRVRPPVSGSTTSSTRPASCCSIWAWRCVCSGTLTSARRGCCCHWDSRSWPRCGSSRRSWKNWLMTSPSTAGGSRALLQTPADPGVVNAAFLLWPWTPVFLIGYAVLGAGNLLLLLATLRRRHRALRNGSMR